MTLSAKPHRQKVSTQPARDFFPTAMRAAALIFGSLLFFAVANAADEPSALKNSNQGPKSIKSVTNARNDKAEKSLIILPKDVKKLIVEDTIVGNGKAASKNKEIKVQYTGWLYDPSQIMGRGKQFDTSVGKEPFKFKLGSGLVIKGWDEGFEGMKVGGKRKLIIPSEMGYGTVGAGADIPPNSPLMFEVELLDVN
jgi:FKBP-type peptidyl-prolyl cis-trans isomerase FkpA